MDKNKEELNRLYRLLCERDKQFEANKLRRAIYTILGFAAVYFWVLIKMMNPESLVDFVMCLVIALVASGFHFFINAAVFGALSQKSQEENETLNHIRKQIAELEKTINERR